MGCVFVCMSVCVWVCLRVDSIIQSLHILQIAPAGKSGTGPGGL